MKILSQLSDLKTLGLINCKQLFMSGTFLSNKSERDLFEEKLQGKKEEGSRKNYQTSSNLNRLGLESIQLDCNTYLSDVLLLRLCGGLRNIKQLR